MRGLVLCRMPLDLSHLSIDPSFNFNFKCNTMCNTMSPLPKKVLLTSSSHGTGGRKSRVDFHQWRLLMSTQEHLVESKVQRGKEKQKNMLTLSYLCPPRSRHGNNKSRCNFKFDFKCYFRCDCTRFKQLSSIRLMQHHHPQIWLCPTKATLGTYLLLLHSHHSGKETFQNVTHVKEVFKKNPNLLIAWQSLNV